MDKSNIEWTDATWNIITGCTLVSAGCDNCYAAKMAATRLKNHPSRKGLTRRNAAGVAKFTGEVRFNEKWLDQPLRWRKPRKIFVCAHGDLFHEDVPDDWIDQVFAVMALCPQHTFQVLTKRADRMREYMNGAFDRIAIHMIRLVNEEGTPTLQETREAHGMPWKKPRSADDWWPLSNVWLGISAEDQTRADERIPDLLDTPAAIRFVSCEPLLGPMDLAKVKCSYGNLGAPGVVNALTGNVWLDPRGIGLFERRGISLDWLIVGGESGQNARPMHPQWARGLRDQCKAAGTAFFFKQWGEWADHSDVDPDECGASEDRVILPTGHMVGGGNKQNGMVQLDWKENCCAWMCKVGKKTAGRLLDGREWNGVPG
jgi:protein gp37